MSAKLAEFRARVGRSLGSVPLERDMLQALENCECDLESAHESDSVKTREINVLVPESRALREALELATATLELFCPSGARSQPKFWQQFLPGSVKEQVVADYCRGVLKGASQAVHNAARAVEPAGVGDGLSDGPKASHGGAP